MTFHHVCIILAVVGTSLAFTAEFIPKSYYVVHSNGEKSPTVYFREKRTLQEPLLPLVRMRRGCDGGCGGGGNGATGGGGATSGSFSSSSSHASSGAGADAIYFGEDFKSGFDAAAKLAGFPNGFPGNIPGAGGAGFPGAAGSCGGCGGYGGDSGHGYDGINLASRFGGDDGVSYSGSAKGAKGVYSASSSSIDSDGNVKYSVKTGKY